jgi:hypothetical protein
MTFGPQDEELKLLAKVLPADEIEEVKRIGGEHGAEKGGGQAPALQPVNQTVAKAWRPPDATIVRLGAAPTPAAPPVATTTPTATPPGANIPGFIKVAVVIASTAIPIGVAILAWKGCS